MTTLTKNRIIEKGDEYLDKEGAWKPVPKDEIGLQIMFSKLKEVRRPNETPKPSGNGSATKPPAERPTLKVGTPQDDQFGTTPVVVDPEAHGLPTVISRKAHTQKSDREIIERIPCDQPLNDEETAALQRESERERVKKHTAILTRPAGTPADPRIERHDKTVAALEAARKGFAEIPFAAGSPTTIWTGRNGTFNSVALNLHRRKDVISIVPQGKRGAARNAIIEFPVSAIPQIIKFLQEQLP